MFSNGSPPGKSGGSTNRSKRNKRYTWGSRERAGMSFLIVVAFFAVFGLIILTEVLMIDERNRGGGVIRHASFGTRIGESLPDYEDNKDYNLEDSALFLRETKFSGIRGSSDIRMAMGIPVVPDNKDTRGNTIPWGQALPTKVERTLPSYPSKMKETDGSWQIVNGTRFKFFVFSAFYDRRDGKMVRIVGATKTRNPEKVWCRFWYPYGGNGTTNGGGIKHWSATVMARVKIIRENWNLKYSACFILCPLKGLASEIPYSVSVVNRLRVSPGNVLLVRNTDTDRDFKNRNVLNIPNKIAVCVKPMHFNYDQALHLLEFIELNSLLGVEHFTLYNHTIGPHASCVLEHYMKQDFVRFSSSSSSSSSLQNESISLGTTFNSADTTKPKITVNLLPWDLRMRSQKEIRTEGLFAALNDCLYRNMYRYSHVALIDFDEFIIPRHNDTLNDLLKWLSLRINNRNTGAYSFQNAFFYLQFPDDDLMYDKTGSNPLLRASLITQRKTRRRSKLHPQKQRSKYICKPESVIEAGNHFVWEFIPGKGSLNVPADSAILHHYRVCEFGGDDCIKTPSLVDRTAHKYTNKLLDRVGAMYEQLKKPCKLPDLPQQSSRPTRKKVIKIKTISANILTNKTVDNNVRVKSVVSN